MIISDVGITFARRMRRDLTVRLADVDRFDVRFDAIDPRERYADDPPPLDGNWRLVLLRRDGTAVPLSGLDHGYFKDNRLFWATGASATRSDATPEDSMPWPNEQPLLVAARLNAHVDVARASPGQGQVGSAAA